MNNNTFQIRNAAICIALGASFIFAGCASVENIDANKTTLTQVKTITALAVREPAAVQVVNLGGAAGAFGLVGGLVQGANNADHSKTFLAALTQRKISLKEPMLAALINSLQADSFEVSVDQMQWPKKAADGKSDDFSYLQVNSDTILVVWFSVVGYMSPPNSVHYQPWVVVKARLIDAKTKQDIYFKTFCVGYEMKLKNAVMIPADPKYRYRSFDDLMAHLDDAIAGLIDSEKLVARQIGIDLAKGP